MGGTIPQQGGPELYKKLTEHKSENKPSINPASTVPHGFCFKLQIEFLPCSMTDYDLEVRAK